MSVKRLVTDLELDESVNSRPHAGVVKKDPQDGFNDDADGRIQSDPAQIAPDVDPTVLRCGSGGSTQGGGGGNRRRRGRGGLGRIRGWHCGRAPGRSGAGRLRPTMLVVASAVFLLFGHYAPMVPQVGRQERCTRARRFTILKA